MSAFTNWNGPGGGPSVPQVITLENLLTKISELQSTIQSVYNDLNTHKDQTPGSTVVHQINAWVTGIKDTIYGYLPDGPSKAAKQSDVQSMFNRMPSGSDKLATEESVGEINQKIPTNTSSTNKLVNQQTITDLKGGTTQDPLPANTTLKSILEDISELANNLKTSVLDGKIAVDSTDANNIFIAISKLIKDAEGFMGPMYPQEKIDFKDFKLINPIVTKMTPVPHPVDTDESEYVSILGMLSEDWINGPTTQEQMYKPCTVYIKYVNTDPWAAVLNAAVARKTDSIDYQGSLDGIASKTTTRPYLLFGLFYGTSGNGKQHVYVGYRSKETLPGSDASSTSIWVAGINFIPLNRLDTGDLPKIDANTPNGIVHTLTSNFVDITGQFETGAFATIMLTTNEVRDQEGNGIAVEVDEDGGPEHLEIGSNPVHSLADNNNEKQTAQLDFFSFGRPTVTIINGSNSIVERQQMAYLTDLVFGLVWQRSVTVIADTLGDLNGTDIVPGDYKVTVSKTTGYTNEDIITWDPAPDPASGHINVPGIYFTNPAADSPNGMVFDATSTALIKETDEGDYLLDGYTNTIVSGNRMLKADVKNSPAISGQVIIDAAGLWYQLGDTDPSNDAYILVTLIENQVPTSLNLYTRPGIAAFDEDTSTWNALTVVSIPVPTASYNGQDYANKISYEYAGNGEADPVTPNAHPYFHEEYIVWTPVYEHGYDNSIDEVWSDIELPLEGYRTSAEQDLIDSYIFGTETVQSDYAEEEAVISATLPGWPGPKTVANPAYIHHKPFAGLSLLEGGNFSSEITLTNYLVDGGNYTGMFNTNTTPGIHPGINRSAKNAIMRQMHGNIEDMPEFKYANPPVTGAAADIAESSNADDYIWETFGRTLRWIDDKYYFIFTYYDEGTGAKKIYRFKPNAGIEDDGDTNYVYDLNAPSKNLNFDEGDGTDGQFKVTASSPALNNIYQWLHNRPEQVFDFHTVQGAAETTDYITSIFSKVDFDADADDPDNITTVEFQVKTTYYTADSIEHPLFSFELMSIEIDETLGVRVGAPGLLHRYFTDKLLNDIVFAADVTENKITVTNKFTALPELNDAPDYAYTLIFSGAATVTVDPLNNKIVTITIDDQLHLNLVDGTQGDPKQLIATYNATTTKWDYSWEDKPTIPVDLDAIDPYDVSYNNGQIYDIGQGFKFVRNVLTQHNTSDVNINTTGGYYIANNIVRCGSKDSDNFKIIGSATATGFIRVLDDGQLVLSQTPSTDITVWVIFTPLN